jgi:hypothetical protein
MRLSVGTEGWYWLWRGLNGAVTKFERFLVYHINPDINVGASEKIDIESFN